MNTRFFLFTICLLSGWYLHGQEPGFRVRLSRDTVLLGNAVAVTFTLENAEGQSFQAPLFEAFDVVGGPNTATSFSIINGKTSRQLSYTYYIQPREAGNYYVEPASIEVDGKILETNPVEVWVLPNPDGKVEPPEPDNLRSPFRLDEIDRFNFPVPAPAPEAAPKKKRKTYKM